jgi:hypothetical protein
MKYFNYLFLILFSNISCISEVDKKEIFNKKLIHEYKKSFNNSQCILLTIEENGFLNENIKYYVWKKHGVYFETYLNEFKNQNYVEAMRQYVIERIGVKKLNIIIKEKEELKKKWNFHDSSFYDSIFFFRVNTDNNYIPQIINKISYYQTLDSLCRIYKENMNGQFIYFWLTINSKGNTEKIELINKDCNEEIKKSLLKTYQKFKWEPAIYKGKYVNYRSLEFLYVSD